MPRYHINNKGNVGVCNAMLSCPFGDLEEDHYETKEAARGAYEEKAKAEALSKWERKTAAPSTGGHGLRGTHGAPTAPRPSGGHGYSAPSGGHGYA